MMYKQLMQKRQMMHEVLQRGLKLPPPRKNLMSKYCKKQRGQKLPPQQRQRVRLLGGVGAVFSGTRSHAGPT